MATNLRYGQVQRSAMNWPIFVADQLGLFGEEELVAESKVFTSPLEPVTALIAGSLDLINVIPDVALLEIVKGAPLAVIANTNSRAQYRLMAQSEIKNFSALKGKKIGVNDGRSAEALILKKLLRLNGLKPDSYDLAATGAPLDRCKKLKEGLVAATMVTQPFNFLLEEEGFRTLASSREIVPDYPFTVCVVRREEIFNNAILSFLKAVSRSWQWLSDQSNRERAIPTLTQWTGTTEKQAQSTYDLYLQPPEPPSLAPTEEGVTTVLELLSEGGRLPRPLPPARKYIDGRYFERLEEKT
ncbi:MAG: ABC transporter substrate-binding protein [Candidatus Binatota bacterium]|jgi:ABC-type nitrate/sulfonate/bicarbonate transport system substrate-binding protein